MSIFRFIILSLSICSCSFFHKVDTGMITEAKASIVEKAFINKAGRKTGNTDLYLRYQGRDYFIKICEGKLSRALVEQYLDKTSSLRFELKEGEWDNCYPTEEVQSRIGNYVVLYSIQ